MLVVLLLMLAITGIAMFSARYAVVGEASSQNKLDHEIARQAAEAALRDAERDLLLSSAVGGAPCVRNDFGEMRFTAEYFVPTCKAGQCEPKPASTVRDWTNISTAEPWWPQDQGGLWNNTQSDKPTPGGPATLCDTFTGGVPLGTYTGAPQVIGVATQPEYLLELMRRGDERFFRITARGFGLTNLSQVVLQSYFRVP